MLLKILLAVLGLALIGAALLSLQQQRLVMAHAMSDLHVQMDRDRKQTWDAQADIAEHAHPVALREAVQRVGLNLVPLPTPEALPPRPSAWPDPQRFDHAPGPAMSPPPPATSVETDSGANASAPVASSPTTAHVEVTP